jgi:phosphate uptake regulator
MKRKIVKQGAATLMISLPSKWCRQNNLKKGDEIDIEEMAKKLVIGVDESRKEHNKAFIDVSGYSPLINRALLSLYVRGIDELEVFFSSHDEIKDFQRRVLNELLGFEIMKQTQKSILIKDITEAADQNIILIIARIFLILDSMAEELINALEKKQKLDPVIEIDASVNKFVNFCLRVLNKKGYKDPSKTPQVYAIVNSLEEIGDMLKTIAINAQEKNKIMASEIENLKSLRKLLDMFRKIFLDFKKEDAVAFAKEYEKIKAKIDNKKILGPYLYELNNSIVRMSNHLLVLAL